MKIDVTKSRIPRMDLIRLWYSNRLYSYLIGEEFLALRSLFSYLREKSLGADLHFVPMGSVFPEMMDIKLPGMSLAFAQEIIMPWLRQWDADNKRNSAEQIILYEYDDGVVFSLPFMPEELEYWQSCMNRKEEAKEDAATYSMEFSLQHYDPETGEYK